MEKSNYICSECKKDCTGNVYFGERLDDLLCEKCADDFYKSDSIDPKPGYHLAKIVRGELGEPSKIYEEVDEFRDAIAQKASIMALVELSDLLGAIGAYLEKYHPSITMDDLAKMREITERAFINGRR